MKLTHEAGIATPLHTFIPWVVIDGDATQQQYRREHLKKAVCERYKDKGGITGVCRDDHQLQQHNDSFLSSFLRHFFEQYWN